MDFLRFKVDAAFVDGVRVVKGKRYVTPDAFRLGVGEIVRCDPFYGIDYGVIDSIVMNYGGAVLFLRNSTVDGITRVPAFGCWVEMEALV